MTKEDKMLAEVTPALTELCSLYLLNKGAYTDKMDELIKYIVAEIMRFGMECMKENNEGLSHDNIERLEDRIGWTLCEISAEGEENTLANLTRKGLESVKQLLNVIVPELINGYDGTALQWDF